MKIVHIVTQDVDDRGERWLGVEILFEATNVFYFVLFTGSLYDLSALGAVGEGQPSKFKICLNY